MVVRLRRSHLLRHQPQPLRHPMHMRVHGQGRPPQGEHQHAGHRLGADTSQRAQPLLRLRQRHPRQERQVEGAAATPHLFQDCPNSRRLHPGQTANLDLRRYLLRVSRHQLLPGGKTSPQASESTQGVCVGGILGEDREHQLRDGVAAGVPDRLPVERRQAPHDLPAGDRGLSLRRLAITPRRLQDSQSNPRRRGRPLPRAPTSRVGQTLWR